MRTPLIALWISLLPVATAATAPAAANPASPAPALDSDGDGDSDSPDPAIARSAPDHASPTTLIAACRDDSLAACHELAYAYSQALGVPHRPDRAALLYAHACDAGYPASCGALGVLYADGRGVPLAGEHALWLLNRACNTAYAPACRALGELHAHGYANVPLLPAAARGAWRAGCDLGDTPSCTALATLGPGPSAAPLPGLAPPFPPLGDALDAPAPPAAPLRERSTPAPPRTWAMFWTGSEVAFSHRNTAALALDPTRYAPNRATEGLELGVIIAQRTGFGARVGLAASFDIPGAFDGDVSNSPRFGGLHLEAAFEGLASLALGDDLTLALGAGWHGLSGPLTKNSSLALSLYLAGPPASRESLSWLLRVTPVQLLASNERPLLSPLSVELRLVLAGGIALGAEFSWVPPPAADTQDTPAEAWALLLRFGTGFGVSSDWATSTRDPYR